MFGTAGLWSASCEALIAASIALGIVTLGHYFIGFYRFPETQKKVKYEGVWSTIVDTNDKRLHCSLGYVVLPLRRFSTMIWFRINRKAHPKFSRKMNKNLKFYSIPY